MTMEHQFAVIYSMKRAEAVLFLIGTVTVSVACVSQCSEFIAVVHPPKETG
jgi:hypothetical protein